MNRRHAVLGAAAVAAGGVAALAWWRSGRPDPAELALAEFLARPLTTPTGQPMPLDGFARRPLLLNFWATWCPPCVREMPELDRFAKAFAARGGQVLGVAIDRQDAVRTFLAKTPVGYPIAVAGFEALPVLGSLGNAAGALPYTLLADQHGRLLHRKMGETSSEELQRWGA